MSSQIFIAKAKNTSYFADPIEGSLEFSMESPNLVSRVLIAYDATKDLGHDEIQVTIKELRLRGDILRRGDTLVVFGVLHKVHHPSESLLILVLPHNHPFLISCVSIQV